VPAPSPQRFLIAGILTAASLGVTGCTTLEVTTTDGALLPPPQGAQPPPFGSASQTSVVTTPLGTIPYDGFTLPLVSPDGRWLATQTGVPPEWPTLLAVPGARLPRASGIEVWEVDGRELERVGALPRGYVLGRAADANGFLVEQPLEDGSRRIGKVAWPAPIMATADGQATPLPTTARIDEFAPSWFIDDGRVNAFATMGTDGSLAWCVRDPGSDQGFALAVRPTSGTAFEVLPEPGKSWMLPTFAADATSLFACCLGDGVTDLAAGSTLDQESFEQSLLFRRLSMRMDARRTYQTLAPQGSSAAVAPGSEAVLVFFHPDLRRMVTWTPSANLLQPLPVDSFAACASLDGGMLVADPDGILYLTPPPPSAGGAIPPSGQPARIFDRAAVPRRLDASPGDFMFFVPDGRNLGVVRFRLVEPPRSGAGLRGPATAASPAGFASGDRPSQTRPETAPAD
jgi:hypothetical protein